MLGENVKYNKKQIMKMGLYFKLRKKDQISVVPHKGRLSNWTPQGIFNDSCTDCIQFPIFWGDNEISVTDNQPIEKRGNKHRNQHHTEEKIDTPLSSTHCAAFLF